MEAVRCGLFALLGLLVACDGNARTDAGPRLVIELPDAAFDLAAPSAAALPEWPCPDGWTSVAVGAVSVGVLRAVLGSGTGADGTAGAAGAVICGVAAVPAPSGVPGPGTVSAARTREFSPVASAGGESAVGGAVGGTRGRSGGGRMRSTFFSCPLSLSD